MRKTTKKQLISTLKIQGLKLPHGYKLEVRKNKPKKKK